MLDRLIKQGCDIGGLGHVGFDGHGVDAHAFDVCDYCVRSGGAGGVVHYEGGAARSELEGVLASHAARRAGHEGDFAVEAGG